jgi:hypothetical protein
MVEGDLRHDRLICIVRREVLSSAKSASVRVLEKTGLRYAESVTFWGQQFSKYIIDG